MGAQHEPAREQEGRNNAPTTRRPDAPETESPGLAHMGHLQRLVGNRAVARLVAQRDPVTPGGMRRAQENPFDLHLHLDPQIEAQIRAINAMHALIAPEQVQTALVNLNLPPQLGAGSGQPPAPQLIPPATPTPNATPQGPAPGTGLMGPRPGTGGDIWKAVLAEPALGPAIEALGEQAATRARAEFDELSTGGKAAVVTGSIVVGGAAITGLLANQETRDLITATLNDVVIPVPKVPGLGVQLNLSGNTMIVGLHLDVGRILPAALGFGPASETTPLGAAPNPYQPVQRQAAAAVEPARTPPGDPVVQRDPIPGGVGGQLAGATGGALGLKSIEGSFTLPAGKVLSSNFKRVLKTTTSNIVTVQISSDQVSLTISNGIYIDAQWPCQNMRVFNITHRFATNETTSDVRLADDEWGDGFIDVTGTARSEIAATIGTIIARTPLDRKRLRPPDPSLGDTRSPPQPQTGPLVPPGAAPPNAPAYDPFADADPKATLDALVDNFKAMPSEGESEVKAEDLGKLSVGATVLVNHPFEQVEAGTGLRIAAGTAVSMQVDSGASVPKLIGAGKGAAALAAAADVQAIHVSSSGIEVLKDGKPLATIDRLTISKGHVKIDHISLLGEAAEAAKTEKALHDLKGGAAGFAESGGIPFGFLLGMQNTINDHADEPVFVPGFVSALLEAKLQAAFTELLAKQGRTIIPGVDLGSVFGVPGAPVTPK